MGAWLAINSPHLKGPQQNAAEAHEKSEPKKGGGIRTKNLCISEGRPGGLCSRVGSESLMGDNPNNKKYQKTQGVFVVYSRVTE